MISEKDAPLFNIFLQQIEVFTQQELFIKDLLEILKNSFRARACSVRFLEDGRLSDSVCVGSESPVNGEQSVRIDRNIKDILKNSSPSVLPDIENDEKLPKRRKNRYLKEGFKSCVFVPLQIDEKENLGILSVYFTTKNPLSVTKLQSLQMYAKMFTYILHKSVLHEDVLELKQLIQNVVEFTTDAILLTDELGKILYVSKQTSRLFRKRANSLIGEYIFQFNQYQNQTIEQALKHARRRRSLIDFDSKIKLASGRELYLKASLSKLQLHRTRRNIYLWLIRDITSLQKAEKELNYKKAELEDFVYSVSHDLKSPIVSIQGYSSLLKDDLYKKFNQTHKHYFDRMVNNVGLMQRMINDLLELSRLGKLDTNITLESIGSIIREALDEFHYQIERKKVKIISPKRFPRIRCNRKSIKLVFTNLISNAIKFFGGQKKPCIELGFIKSPDENVFFVRDNGIGMSENETKKIFNVFYRSQILKGVEGTGIGLTVAKKVVQYHGGNIWVESEPGIGSVFYLSLPKVISEFSR